MSRFDQSHEVDIPRLLESDLTLRCCTIVRHLNSLSISEIAIFVVESSLRQSSYIAGGRKDEAHSFSCSHDDSGIMDDTSSMNASQY